MHELPIMENILKVVISYAARHKASKILSIHLKIGEMSHLQNDLMQHYFNYLSKQTTIAQGANLEIEKVPVCMQCGDCGSTFQIDIKQDQEIECPYCGGGNSTLISGREYFISHMEVV